MYLGAKGVSAVISPCGKFRYRLTRQWGEGAALPFVMLNPSTADAEQDDPTIRKCVGFAKRMGYDGIEVVNLYAYRATKPTQDRKSTRLNSSHVSISYAVFCLKKKKQELHYQPHHNAQHLS